MRDLGFQSTTIGGTDLGFKGDGHNLGSKATGLGQLWDTGLGFKGDRPWALWDTDLGFKSPAVGILVSLQ